MRVTVSDSMDLEDVPQKVTELLEMAKSRLVDIEDFSSNAVMAVASEKNYLAANDQIIKIRNELGKMDATLADCMSILSGYTTTLAGMQTADSTKEKELVSALEQELLKMKHKQEDPDNA